MLTVTEAITLTENSQNYATPGAHFNLAPALPSPSAQRSLIAGDAYELNFHLAFTGAL
jgi:hypothetical protein